jgi:hypothetical protein
MTLAPQADPCHQMQIGDHALCQQGFGLGTSREAEGGRATPRNTEREWQQERCGQQHTSSRHCCVSMRGINYIANVTIRTAMSQRYCSNGCIGYVVDSSHRNRSLNQEDISGKSQAVQNGDKQTRSRTHPEAVTGKSGGQQQRQESQRAAPGTPARQLQHQTCTRVQAQLISVKDA